MTRTSWFFHSLAVIILAAEALAFIMLGVTLCTECPCNASPLTTCILSTCTKEGDHLLQKHIACQRHKVVNFVYQASELFPEPEIHVVHLQINTYINHPIGEDDEYTTPQPTENSD